MPCTRRISKNRESSSSTQTRQKKITWNTTIGLISAFEQIYRDLQSAETIRPFSLSANVKCRGRSRRLELVLLDFGADHAFKKAVEKVYRHYGVKVAENTTRLDVYKHATTMQKADYALSG